MAEFLFEIGFEEMPAPWLSGLADQLRAKFTSLADVEQLTPSNTRVLWTSRRLVLVADVKARQDDRTVVEWGPAARIAKDAAGNWSKAAEGFARKSGVALDQLQLRPKLADIVDVDQFYVSGTKHVSGRQTLDVLADLLPSILRGFNFAKRMNWDAWLDDGRGAFEFGRPIQWIVALLDGEVVPLTIFDAAAGTKGAARVVSGRRSMGNRFYPRGGLDRGFDVKSFEELQSGLKSRFVVLNPKDRAARISDQIRGHGGSEAEATADLTVEWRDLVEWPTVAAGRVPLEFKDLPAEIVETVLAAHQKAMLLRGGNEATLTFSERFLVITGADEAGAKTAASGQERVVVARLKDARFFFAEDTKRFMYLTMDPSNYLAALEQFPVADITAATEQFDGVALGDVDRITFHKGLGSYADKIKRVRHVAHGLVPADDYRLQLWLREAVQFAKVDLASSTVREFPELQGVVGALLYYRASTREFGEKNSIAYAIRFQYLPLLPQKSAGPHLPAEVADRRVFAILSLTDKLDTLVGYFGLGLLPTGSADPYGLRRAAQGLLRVLLDFWEGPQPSLREFLGHAYRAYKSPLPKTLEETVQSLAPFASDRLRAVLIARNSGSLDEVEAVMTTPRVDALSDVQFVETRLRALVEVRSESREVFSSLAEAFKRAKNIVGDGVASVVDENLFAEDAERRLFSAIRKAEGTPASDPAARLRAVAALRADVDAFFTGVMVNAEDLLVRANRHGVLHRLLDLVYEVADLSKLATPAGDKAVSS